MPLVINRSLETHESVVVVDRRIVVTLYAHLRRSVVVTVRVDGGPVAPVELPIPASRKVPIRYFPLAPGVRVGVSERLGLYAVRLAFDVPDKSIEIKRGELLSQRELRAAAERREREVEAA